MCIVKRTEHYQNQTVVGGAPAICTDVIISTDNCCQERRQVSPIKQVSILTKASQSSLGVSPKPPGAQRFTQFYLSYVLMTALIRVSLGKKRVCLPTQQQKMLFKMVVALEFIVGTCFFKSCSHRHEKLVQTGEEL